MSYSPRVYPNGIDRAMREIGGGRSLLIIWEALHGTTRFENFQINLGIARSSLCNRLAKLVDAGVLVKRPVHPGSRRLAYRVTPRGEALRPALELMAEWGRADASNNATSGADVMNVSTR